MMTMPIDHLRRIIDKLQTIVDEADDHGCTEVNMSCNTYGMHNFVGCGSYGYLNFDKDIDDLLDLYEETESDDL